MTSGVPTRERVLERVRSVMVQLDFAPEDVAESASLVDTLEFDSLDWLDLALSLEEVFDVALREERLASVRTVGDVADRVLAALGSTPAS